MSKSRRGGYGLLNFVFDIVMLCITAGLWIIWIFIREMRGLRQYNLRRR